MGVKDQFNRGSAALTDLLPKRFQPAGKAVFTAIAGGLITFAAVSEGGVTAGEWGLIVVGVLFPGGTAYGATNKPKSTEIP